MLRFNAYRKGAPVADVDLEGAYVFGQDGIPIRADISSANGQVSAIKRVPGACGLSLMWQAGAAGNYMLNTTRLPERSKPYNLNLELARGQLCRIAQKREDWGLFDFAEAAAINKEYDAVRLKFVEAIKTADPGKAADIADEVLLEAITLGEKMALFHADILLTRRRTIGAAARTGFGCVVDAVSPSEEYGERIRGAFDLVSIPVVWKATEPKERQYQYNHVDAWVNWAVRNKKNIHMGPLLSFEPSHIPEWLFLWEHDYEALRDVIYEHIQRIVTRYDKQVKVWNVVSGIHAYNSFNLNFEQLMELTRMSCLLVKKLAPQSQVMIDLTMPWGEYYARNQRTIPPLLYADMAVQSGVKFDAFGVQLHMGVPLDGLYVRDVMQLGMLIDEFASMGKTVHITSCQTPSDMAPDPKDAWGGQKPIAKGGLWHQFWSQRLQAEWLLALGRLAISRPFVESICWRDLTDGDGHYLPHGGLCRADLQEKLAYKELKKFKLSLAAPSTGEAPRKKPANPA